MQQNIDTLHDELMEHFSPQSEQKRQVYSSSIRAVLIAIEALGYGIFKTRGGNFTSTDIDSFSTTIMSWNTKPEVELEDINGHAILDSLIKSGWTILPPQS